MKLFKKIRKGFTLIELVVVIAVIAIISGVTVVSYIAITNKAKQSSDQQRVDQINLSLQADETVNGKPKTMYDALQVVAEEGYNVEKFKTESKDYSFAYLMSANKFVLLEKGAVAYPKKVQAESPADLWLFTDTTESLGENSYYLRGSDATGEITVKGGFDVGNNDKINLVKYDRSTATNGQEVTIRTQSGDLEVDAKLDTVYHYGKTGFVKITNIDKEHSYHEYGEVLFFVELAYGTVHFETANDYNLVINATSAEDVNYTKNSSANVSLSANDEIKSAIETKFAGQEVKSSSSTIVASNYSELVSKIDLVNNGTLINPTIYLTGENYNFEDFRTLGRSNGTITIKKSASLIGRPGFTQLNKFYISNSNGVPFDVAPQSENQVFVFSGLNFEGFGVYTSEGNIAPADSYYSWSGIVANAYASSPYQNVSGTSVTISECNFKGVGCGFIKNCGVKMDISKCTFDGSLRSSDECSFIQTGKRWNGNNFVNTAACETTIKDCEIASVKTYESAQYSSTGIYFYGECKGSFSNVKFKDCSTGFDLYKWGFYGSKPDVSFSHLSFDNCAYNGAISDFFHDDYSNVPERLNPGVQDEQLNPHYLNYYDEWEDKYIETYFEYVNDDSGNPIYYSWSKQ